MTVFLCTCGTSAAKKITNPRFNADWVINQGGVTAAAATLFETFKNYRITDENALTQHLSAEIHSLARMKLEGNDRVVLFSSETDDGQTCAEALKLYLKQEFPEINCVVSVIKGLQVRDANRFRTEGVVNFVKKVLQEIDGYGADHCILNPTGGFKSLVPYTVLIGMIKGVQARYIFEQSTELLTLPTFPVEFARERLEPLQPLIECIERESSISKNEWEQKISYNERHLYAPLFEIEDGQVTLSPVGFLILEELRQLRALVPFISLKAINDMQNIRDMTDCKPADFIQRVAMNRQQFDNAKHDSLTNGLVWLKPGAHTRDRYLVSIEGWRLLVWRIADHKEYEELLDRNRKSDVGKQIVEERRKSYAPFFRMESYE